MLKKIEKYIAARLLLIKIELAENAAKVLAMIYTYVFLAILLALFLIFISFFIALVFGEIFGNVIYGFGIVTGIYFTAFMVVLIFRKKLIERPILNATIRKFFEKSVDENSKKQKSN